MNRLFKSALAILLFQLVFSAIYAQDNKTFLQQAVQGLNKRSATLPVEKVYLQTDKPLYAAGDTIWFKAYTTIGVLHRLSAKSGVLHIQLVKNNKVAQYLKLQLDNGLCSGAIILPDSLEEGNYQLRAYTNWMHNFGSDYFFQKDIPIGNAILSDVNAKANYSYKRNYQSRQLNANIHYSNISGNSYAGTHVVYNITRNNKTVFNGSGTTDEKGDLKISYQSEDSSSFGKGIIHTVLQIDKKKIIKDISIRPSLQPFSLQFFPEGGYMVNDVSSTIAFKAIGPDGLGRQVTGVITDNENHVVAQFSSTHLGMGLFKFTPQSGKRYIAIVNNASGDKVNASLPGAKPNGYVMAVDNTDTSRVVVMLTGNQPADTAGTLNLIGQANGVVCYATGIKINGSQPIIIKIPKSRFPNGITQFTLFSATGEPISERMAFIRHTEDLLNLQLTADKSSYQPNEKAVISLTANDKLGKPVAASLSATVINDTDIHTAEDAEASILSALLLTSDIKGYVEQPGYYFNRINAQTEADLDVLMLTQGYRVLGWKELAAGDINPVYPVEKAMRISGTLKTPAGKPVARGKVRLLTTVGAPVMLDTVADQNGRFAFSELEYSDSTRVILQATTRNDGSNVVIEVNDPDSRVFIGMPGEQDVAIEDTIPQAYLQKSKKLYDQNVKYRLNKDSKLLKEVTVNEVKPERRTANLNGPGHASQVIDGETLITCPNLEVCLIGKLNGIVVDVNGTPHSPRNKLSFIDNDVVAVMIDGVFVLDPSGLSPVQRAPSSPFKDIDPTTVASVEVLMDPADLAIYGTRAKKGLIIINTRRGDEHTGSTVQAANLLSYMPKGYAISRKFYEPVYTVPENVQKSDLRTTVCWKSNLFTDEKGNVSFNYFNAGTGNYRILVEGIDNDGNLGRQVYRYEIKQAL